MDLPTATCHDIETMDGYHNNTHRIHYGKELPAKKEWRYDEEQEEEKDEKCPSGPRSKDRHIFNIGSVKYATG
jgi:hypothetical protein